MDSRLHPSDNQHGRLVLMPPAPLRRYFGSSMVSSSGGAPPSYIFEESKNQVRSMILTSQLPVSRWHEQIGDPTLADGILDRLVHNAHRIEMRGESMRKQRGEKGEK